MELRRLRYFLAVAESLNFTAAAKSLGIAQPPLSTQIKQLEAEVGQPLFHRTSRKVSLTDAGKLLSREATALVEQADRIAWKLSDLRDGRSSGVKLGIDESVADLKLARQIRKFMKKHRGIRCEIQFFRSGEDKPLDGYDAVIVDRSEWGEKPCIELGNTPIWLVIPKKHRFCDRVEIQTMDLVGEQVLLSPPGYQSKAEEIIFSKDPECRSRVNSEWVSGGIIERIWRAEAGFGVTIASEYEAKLTDATAVPFALDAGSLSPVLGYREESIHSGLEPLLVHFRERLSQ